MRKKKGFGGWEIFQAIGRGGIHLSAILLFLTMIAIVFNSILRYVFGGGIHVILESSRFVMMLVVFLGLAGTHMVRGHVTVDLLLRYLSPRVTDVLHNYFVPTLSVTYVCFLLWSGLQMTVKLWRDGTVSTGITPIPLAPIMAVMPIGSFLLMLAIIGFVVSSLKSRHANPEHKNVVSSPEHKPFVSE